MNFEELFEKWKEMATTPGIFVYYIINKKIERCPMYLDDPEASRKIFNTIEKLDGFMFWYDTEEGNKWLKDDWEINGKEYLEKFEALIKE